MNALNTVTAQIIAGILLFASSYWGNPFLYVLAALTLIILMVVVTIHGSASSSVRIFTLAFGFMIFRYLPIVKYGQPLFDDPWSDLRTAEFFASANRIFPIPLMSNDHLTHYSRWPALHILTIVVAGTIGVPLLDVFTFFGPVIAFPSILFIYLTGRNLLSEPKKAAIAALIFSTFSIPLFWQLQVVRQNLALTVLCAGLYTYVKARKINSRTVLILSFFLFSLLPLVHHLTALAAMITLSIAYALERLYWRTQVSANFLIFVWLVTLLTWTVFQADIIFPSILSRAFGLLLLLGEGRLGKIQSRLQTHFDVFDLLNLVRVLYLASAAIIGLVMIARRRFSFGGLLAGLFVGCGIPLAVALLSQEVDERFALLLSVPTVFLVAHSQPKNKQLLGLILILVVGVAPFKLYETFNAAPTYVYDAGKSVNFSYGEFSKFRGADVFELAKWNAEFNNGRAALADRYNTEVLQQYYDPVLIYVIAPYDPNKVAYHPNSDMLVFFTRYYAQGRFGPKVITDLKQVVSQANLVYNDGSQVGYFLGP